ncbi:MAG: M3 family oligoendopeptidase [Bacteroidota bacterium]|nr:M3 family oligoendopeptidase [Bacteroidota bacterium]MDP4233985.1 M3 family oligoendopeptidase [Bacteroidota bacterium]MDP4242852.1 M3 family oligoendopeptidase [Bacteroidota bacterium]MDP4287710.1 M3 family oligoendopeptidase [Bacteroidota bacterium]
MTYKYYPNRPERLTKEFVDAEYAKLLARVDAAEASSDPKAWIELYGDWNALSAYVSGEASRTSYQHAAHMNDPKWDEADKYVREHLMPAYEKGGSIMLDFTLKSRHRDAIGKHFGPYLIEALMTQVEPMAPINSDLRIRERDLADQYDKIVAAGEVEVLGKKVTLPVARNMQSESDPATRKAAFFAYRQWFLDHHDALGTIFDQLVHARDQEGRNLGHKNYIPLGYELMRRTDYGPAEAKAFRDSVLAYAVPLAKRLREQHAAILGEHANGKPAQLKPWDAGYHPELTLPTGIAPVDSQLDKAQNVFEAISPRLAKHFTRMRKEGLIDLENRREKRAGAFCTSFPDEGRVAIFCNSTGDEDDVSTLMHEMGHAFQAWESQPIEAVDLQWPTSDMAEVHSMGMEFLSMPEMTQFFSPDNARKFERKHLYDVVSLMCYICVVDEFQHWVYEHPNVTLAERDAAWSEISDKYTQGMDYTGIEAMKYARWYAQAHIFQTPFYYIDYAIAQTGAMQLGMMNAENHDKALDTYIKICVKGGTKSVLTTFKEAGLRSPFDPNTMRDLMAFAAKTLDMSPQSKAGVAA